MDEAFLSYILVSVLAAVGLAYFFGLFSKNKEAETSANDAKSSPSKESKSQAAKAEKPQPKRTKRFQSKSGKPEKHPRERVSLRGHSANITAIAWSGKIPVIVTAAEDRALLLYSTEQSAFKGKSKDPPRYLRHNLDNFDHCSNVTFVGPKVVAISAKDATLRAYNVAVKNEEISPIQPSSWSVKECMGRNIGVRSLSALSTVRHSAESQSFVDHSAYCVTCADTTAVKVWDVDLGKCVHSFDTHQFRNYRASTHSTYLSVATFSSDCRIWSAPYSDTAVSNTSSSSTSEGSVWKGLVKAMDLPDHSGSVLDVHLNDRYAVTVSKDGVLRLFRIDVRWHQNEDPKLLTTVQLPENMGESARVRMSPGGDVFAVLTGRTITLYTFEVNATHTAAKTSVLDTMPLKGERFADWTFSPDGSLLAVAADRQCVLYDMKL